MTPSKAEPSRVVYCRNSNIVEAWARVMGTPGPLDTTEAAGVRRRALREFPDLAPRPAIIAHATANVADLIPPHWNQQWSWDEGQYLSRFGHRYLSVHFVRQTERYQTYDESLRSQIQRWLEVYAHVLEGVPDQAIETITFGYSNAFAFPADDFDVSRYLKLNLGIEVGVEAALGNVRTSFTYFNPANGLRLVVDVNIGGPSPVPGEETVPVVTRVLAELVVTSGLGFGSVVQIMDRIGEAKEAAKTAFFNFTTLETHDIMGVVHNASDGPEHQ